MARRPYTSERRSRGADSVERVLEAAERLMREGAFHLATVDELAAAAGVSRATVFNRFGSKLGVVQALFTRAMEGPEMDAIRAALELDDPVAALEAAIEASCAIWESYAFIHEQLQAIVVLEPDASALVDQQREQQRAELQALTRRLSRARRLRPGLGEARAAATLHMLTSLETFLWLRRDHVLSLRQTHETIAELARTLLAS
ncbi:MAG TPA: helix-turn-helix domain-containing protein [Gaiella sp.]|nr:helix-turn-helix domain-containing protein [Gaiella sp.]